MSRLCPDQTCANSNFKLSSEWKVVPVARHRWTPTAINRTRPDLVFAVSPTAQVLTTDLELLKVKLRHILQYLNTTKTTGLLYLYPPRSALTEFTVFGDSSFPPSGRHSQSGFTVDLSFGKVRHLIQWQSLREPKVAESSAESELHALASARKAARNFRLLIRESFATSIIMSLRCSSTAAISMLEEPGWRTRYISFHGEAARQEMINPSRQIGS